jgi:hypothetical protein
MAFAYYAGTFYGWRAFDNQLLTIDEATNAVTPVAQSFGIDHAAVDAAGLYTVDYDEISARSLDGTPQGSFYSGTSEIHEVELNSTHLWIVEGSNLRRIDRGTGAATTVATNVNSFGLTATEVAYLTYASDLRKQPIGGGAETTLLTGLVGVASKVEVEAGHAVFFINTVLHRISLAGGAPVTLDVLSPGGTSYSSIGEDIEVGNGKLYFSQMSQGLMRLDLATLAQSSVMGTGAGGSIVLGNTRVVAEASLSNMIYSAPL